MKNQKGFSLVELLVVVIIIAIIAAIAIPSLLASRRAANQASAISSLRTIHSAQQTYFSTAGLNANYATLPTLASTAGGDLIDDVLGAASGQKSGYEFLATLGTGQYCATAERISSSTGERAFSVSTPGVIYGTAAAADTAPTCSTTDGAITGGTPIQ